jgi:carboxypeptidase PM20D1
MNTIDRFCEAIRIKTDWPGGALAGDAEAEGPLCRFQEFLVRAYPAFHKAAERWVLGPYSLIYRWPGSEPQGKPVLMLAHYDVVPVEAEKWTVDPFGGEVKDGFVYGRGTLDMKSILIGMMEGAEALCAGGFRPREDVWFAFGGDEERTGVLGAPATARWFAERGLRFSWILDEGTPIGENQIKGVDSPLALVSIEEKGYLSLAVSVNQKPGHASRPPNVQAAAVLARALLRIARKPFPFTLIPTVESFFSGLAPFAAGGRSWAMKHARLLGPFFFRALKNSPDITAMLHTTAAMTQLEGSSADNVLPSTVRAVINLRLLQPWTVEKTLARIKKVIRDERVSVAIHGLATEPVPANPEHARGGGPGWKEMERALSKVFPGIPMLPFIMTATTDSRHYHALCDGIFRFSPQRLTPAEMAGIHGHDERISLENLAQGVQFYTSLLGDL